MDVPPLALADEGHHTAWHIRVFEQFNFCILVSAFFFFFFQSLLEIT